jgi:hypothetical protein
VRALAVVADAGVHDAGQPVDLDDPALHRDARFVGVGSKKSGTSRSALSSHPEGGVLAKDFVPNSN